MILKRKIYKKLLEWKKECQGKKALLIEGARRIGKSTICEEFGKSEYKSFLLIDFAKKDKEVEGYFEKYLNDLDTFFMLLQTHFGTKLTERNSLIIFDEVQMFPQARAAIKYLVADGRYDYIETGSLISIKKNVKDILIPSEEENLKMYPFDFEEFLWAMGNDTLMDFIKDCYLKNQPLGQALHRKAMDCFKEYLIVGGMPQAVEMYSKTRDFEKVDRIKRNILNLYREDIRKHAEELNLKVEQIFDTIPSQLQKHEKKFNISSLDEEARYRNFEGAFYWLNDAYLVNIAYNTTEPSIGLGQRMDTNALKCYMFDTGLLLSMTFNEKNLVNEQIYKKILFDKLSFNEGMILENIVAQMLVSSGRKLYFFSRNERENSSETMEVDFLISTDKITSKHNIIPIEVKSGDRYTFTSLNKLRLKYNEYLAESVIIHTKDLKEENNILYIPIYMTDLL